MSNSLTIRQYCLFNSNPMNQEQESSLLKNLEELEISDFLSEPFLERFNLHSIDDLRHFVEDKINAAVINYWKLKEYPRYLASLYGANFEMACDYLNITDQQVFAGNSQALKLLTSGLASFRELQTNVRSR